MFFASDYYIKKNALIPSALRLFEYLFLREIYYMSPHKWIKEIHYTFLYAIYPPN